MVMSEKSMLRIKQKSCIFFLFLIFPLLSACERSFSPPPAVKADADPPTVTQQTAAENYQQHCAQCHEGGVPRAPHSITFQMIGSQAVLKSMIDGVMQLQAETMTKDELRRLAEHLGGSSLDSASTRPLKICEENVASPDLEQQPRSSDWGINPQNTRFITGDIAGLESPDVPQLRLKWAFAYPNATRARSQPVIAGNTVFMGSQDGTIYALDVDSGCVRWTFEADAEVRSAITIQSGRPPQRHHHRLAKVAQESTLRADVFQ